MISKMVNIHFRVINVWFTFVLLLIILSNLPHQSAPFISWINCAIYFLLFLQSTYLLRHESKNKDIFLNISLFALFHSLSFLYVFAGSHELIGNDYTAWYFYGYLSIFQSFVFAFCIIYICVKYFLKNLSTFWLYTLSLGMVLLFVVWHYYPFIIDKGYIINHDGNFDKSMLIFDFLPLTFIGLFAVLLYQYDWSLGEHINSIMVCFFIMLLMDITNLAGNIYSITIFSLSQYVLTLTLSFFILTMFRRLNFAYSEFGQFYDDIVMSGNKWGVPIKRKKGTSLPIVEFAKAYFHQRRNTIGFFSLVSIFCINYFKVSPFLKLNLAVICFGVVVLFFYLTALYQKRLRNGDLIKIHS